MKNDKISTHLDQAGIIFECTMEASDGFPRNELSFLVSGRREGMGMSGNIQCLECRKRQRNRPHNVGKERKHEKSNMEPKV